MNIPEDLYYTKEHEWARLEGDTAVIGITDYAQGELGDIVYVELPEPGRELERMEAFGSVEAVKTVSDLFCPLSGKVIAVNEELNDHPEKVNSDPYHEGWMIKIEIRDRREIEELLDAAAYKNLLEGKA